MIARRSVLHVLMGLELVLSAATINFVAFARFRDDPLDGQVFALCVTVMAAAQVAVALAMLVSVARAKRS